MANPAKEADPTLVPDEFQSTFRDCVRDKVKDDPDWLDSNMDYMVKWNLFCLIDYNLSDLSHCHLNEFATGCQIQIHFGGNASSADWYADWYAARAPWALDNDLVGIVENCGVYRVEGICIFPYWRIGVEYHDDYLINFGVEYHDDYLFNLI